MISVKAYEGTKVRSECGMRNAECEMIAKMRNTQRVPEWEELMVDGS